ncbi:phytanoyl-CoA dioxygenase family protein [Limnothrix sp. FACHB-1083]|uniref:phytanoyl-CoA dioxygenase family protein n=1 Tax=unclassified Limnothrix TaxID=2632864 RepID=UPI0016812CB1|nr:MULTISPECIES: phytanoyl-CoA dioxygenase family protein [unclassified Limnothrix]MBD2160625.1 phytanoyl-CoA dioxygenase family protein [Limnothrix sp. FACHB-1083]MBD2191531.1 phytanoyl-CoA dioxygenase family protein [Limnothrix sp. FACHB-1088]
MKYSLSQFTDVVPDSERPPLDRVVAPPNLTPDQEYWRKYGYLIIENLIPHDLIDRYCERFTQEILGVNKIGYFSPTPYLEVDEIKDLCLYPPLLHKLQELIGYEMAMHLNLTNWKSTERNWHQDDYLNPVGVNAHYAGVWFALDYIHPDAGPFEFVPGSHRWEVCRRERILAALPPDLRDDPAWPSHSEKILTPLYEEEIPRKGIKPVTWCGKKGDVLIWHGWLLHRGSYPKDSEILRPTIITHYSSIQHRPDMPYTAEHKYHDQPGKYFVFERPSEAELTAERTKSREMERMFGKSSC